MVGRDEMQCCSVKEDVLVFQLDLVFKGIGSKSSGSVKTASISCLMMDFRVFSSIVMGFSPNIIRI